MQTTINRNAKSRGPAAFPLLHRLALSPEEFAALTLQGSIGAAKRGGKTIHRLRFRLNGRQCVRYVSPRDAAAVAAELERLQHHASARRGLAGLAARARQALRERRAALGPLLAVRGYHYHGYHVRRFRNTA